MPPVKVETGLATVVVPTKIPLLPAPLARSEPLLWMPPEKFETPKTPMAFQPPPAEIVPRLLTPPEKFVTPLT